MKKIVSVTGFTVKRANEEVVTAKKFKRHRFLSFARFYKTIAEFDAATEFVQ